MAFVKKNSPFEFRVKNFENKVISFENLFQQFVEMINQQMNVQEAGKVEEELVSGQEEIESEIVVEDQGNQQDQKVIQDDPIFEYVSKVITNPSPKEQTTKGGDISPVFEQLSQNEIL